jgi:putative ABC transport system permease protein
VKHVDPDWLTALGIRVLAGRPFDADDRANAPAVALVNRTAANLFFGAGSPVGQVLRNVPPSLSGGRPITVVGVVPDIRQRDVAVQAEPELFVPVAQQGAPWGETLVVQTGGDPEALLPAIRRVLRETDPELATTRLSTMEAVVDHSMARFRFMLLVLGAFAVLALVLAILGLYAVVAYLAVQRTREIGVRLALGAQRGDVLRLVVGEGAGLIALGILGGVASAWVLTGLLSDFLYQVDARDAGAFAGAPLILALVAMLASLLPALRASRVDPVTTLRHD